MTQASSASARPRAALRTALVKKKEAAAEMMMMHAFAPAAQPLAAGPPLGAGRRRGRRSAAAGSAAAAARRPHPRTAFVFASAAGRRVGPKVAPQEVDQADGASPLLAHLARRLLSGGLAAALAASALLSAPAPAAAGGAEPQQLLQVHFPASRDPKMAAAQKTLVQAWGLAREMYLDPSLNGADWDGALGEGLAATFAAERQVRCPRVGSLLCRVVE